MADIQDTGRGTGSAWRNNPYAGPRYGDATGYSAAAFDGVLTKRFIAFLIDLFILSVPIVLVTLFIAVFGIVTLGLGWALFWLVSPLSVVWALVYYGASLGGPHAATAGMRILGIHMETLSGGRPYFLLGVAHAVAYWFSVSFLTPLVVIVGLFNRRKQLLHDLALGTVIVNTSTGRRTF